MKKMVHLVCMITLLLCNIQSSESPINVSRLAGSHWPTALPLVQGRFCPPHIAETKCECVDRGPHVYVDCRGMKLSDVPSVFPPNTWRLDLSGNLIAKIGPEDLRNLDVLVEFLCNDCQLKELLPGSFRYTKKVRRINLSNNNLMHIDTNLFENLANLIFVDLTNNTYLNQNCISELKKKYPKVEFKFSDDMDKSTSMENDTTEASTETVETSASETKSSGTQTSQNTTNNPLGSTPTTEPSATEPNTTVLTHTDKPKIKDSATSTSTWIIVAGSVITVMCLVFGFMCWKKRNGQFCQQNVQDTEQELRNAETRTIINSAAHLLSQNQEDQDT